MVCSQFCSQVHQGKLEVSPLNPAMLLQIYTNERSDTELSYIFQQHILVYTNYSYHVNPHTASLNKSGTNLLKPNPSKVIQGFYTKYLAM